jgi:hypothetical protein
MICQLTLPVSITEVNSKPQRHPAKEHEPAAGGYFNHEIKAKEHPENGDQGEFTEERHDRNPGGYDKKDQK